jgi:hypothetical protein
MKKRQPYITDPKEVYALELKKLQRCFSQVQELAEGISEVERAGWRQVEHLRQFNFLLEEVTMVGRVILNTHHETARLESPF